jgi:hypothetical protein
MAPNLEMGSSSKGHTNKDQSHTNKDQSLVTGTIHTTAAASSPSKNIPTMKNAMELLGMKCTGAGRSQMKWAMTMRNNLKAAKLTSTNANSLLQFQWKGHWKVTPAIRTTVVDWIMLHEQSIPG